MRLLEWSLATFHTCLFFVLVTLVVYLSGGLGSLLGSLNTLVGTAVFLLFWLTTWYTTHRAVRRSIAPERWPQIGQQEFVNGLFFGPLWGGINGVLFFLVLLWLGGLALLVVAIARSDLALALQLPALTLVLIVGTPVAFIIGVAVGLVFAIIDNLMLAGARAIARSLEGQNPSP